MDLKKYSSAIKGVIAGLLFSLGMGVIFAQWSDPPGQPYEGQPEYAFIDIGSELQSKAGSLWAGFLGSDGAGYIDGNLEVGGRVTIGGGNPAAGKILVSEDNEGRASWQNQPLFSCVQRQSSASNSDTLLSPACGSAEFLSGGGGSCGTGSLRASKPNGQAWEIQCSRADNITANSLCCSNSLITAYP